ncbi:MAG: sulfite exporter TauE/SafE family protein, partial [Nitrosomonadales bacterium]|nr:sulfite exporter TauE/SafE family protein [Nitrosomonadales bacterium]
MEIIIFLFSGIFIGVIAGLFGLGGGLLIVPVLTYSLIFFSKIPLEQAILIAIST